LLIANPVAAFFIGDIDIKSNFGETFNASFEVHLDSDAPYEVVIGDANDYNKLGLKRPSLVDSLELEKPIATGGVKKVIRIFSKTPLFFPSFNLVVIAMHNGGTLLENFLITVDFQQGLALNALGKKKTTAPPGKAKVVKKEVPAEKEKVSSKNSELPEPEIANLPQKPDVETEKISVPTVKILTIAPTPIVNRLQNRRRLSGAIWAVPKNVSTFPALSNEDSSAISGQVEEARSNEAPPSRETIELGKGEGLFSVARRIKIQDIHPAQLAVALWMRNIDKFIYGNINGIQAGTILDKTGVEKLATKINLQTAKDILNSQTQEWKLTKEKKITSEEIKSSVQEVPLPVERLDQVASVFDWVAGWKSSWEENDIGKHISYYRENISENSKEIPTLESAVRKKKKSLFLKFPNPRLKLSSQNLISKQGGTWVVFEQHFFSQSLESLGTKEIRMDWENENWKIAEEKFYAEKHEVTESLRKEKNRSQKNNPFVIHVSSHSKESEAFSASNKLRENGYDTYTAPVRISKDIQIYRVYIGRFATWDRAFRVIKVLKEKRLAGHATAIPYPFALQVGEVKSIEAARQLLEKLRLKRVSGFLSISNEGMNGGVLFRVLVGAFKKPENAIWLMQVLKDEGFSFKKISP
ncbi:MAG: hypothetical protein HOK41_03055, partial [Nitrospina sp.]|nr:hypothetical protein [Nitrospina sp.]